MKILDIPQSGKRGLNVSQDGQFGQISRAAGRVANPRTPSQMTVRDNLSHVSARWRALQETQRAAWIAAAKDAMSNPRLNQSGPLSGFLLFTKINCTLAQFGQAQVDAPPAQPQFPTLAPQNLVITNTSGVIALKLACPGDPADNTIVGAEAAEPGRRSAPTPYPRYLPCPCARLRGHHEPLHGPLWRAAGWQEVYIRVNQSVDGWESLGRISGHGPA